MKLTLQIQLLPERDHAARLRATVERFNEAANWLAGVAFEHRCANKIELQKVAYRDLRERFGLSSQMAVRCIAQVCEAFKRDRSIRPEFRPHASMPFDRRMMSFQGADRVSLLTLDGRIPVAFVMGKYQREQFTNARGQSDLVLRSDGKWFLLVTVDVPEAAPIPTTDFLGVDLGIANIATDSDGERHSGKPVEDTRQKHNRQRKRLQEKGTKGAKKKLKRVGKKEARFRKHENHVISKTIVEAAKRTGRGIALEDLKGIRERTRARGGDARNRLSGWSFHQLFSFLSYKAQRAGVPVVRVDPRYTSQTCPECGHRERSNRKSQSEFRCKACGHEQHADVVGARNIRNAALSQGGAPAVPRNAAGTGHRPVRKPASQTVSRKAAGL
jgi:IS605 OrfB family transposase